MSSLAGRVAIVTGAARGIGRATAERLLAEGMRVVLADTDGAAGAQAAHELGARGEARFVACDVSDAAQVTALVDAAAEAFGGIDVLVNNAGIIHKAGFLDLTEQDFDRVLSVNLKGAFLLSQAVARHMVERVEAGGRPGAIVNMSSINAVMTTPDQLAYASSKGGLSQMTRAMALALAPHGIRVNAVGPGSIATDMLASAMTDDGVRRAMLSRTPLGRIGDPAEIAAVVAFLASDEASYVTGQTIYADGGRMALQYTVPVA